MAQIIKLNEQKQGQRTPRTPVAHDALQREIDYWRSRKILDGMLREGLISKEESKKIDVLNRQSFCPALAELMA